MSMPAASISASTRSRRAARSCAASGCTSVIVTRASERVVRVVGHGLPPVLGDDENLLGAVAARAVLPDDRLEHEDRPGYEDEGRVEGLADVAADVGHLGAVDAEPVAQVEVRHPRLVTTGGLDRGCGQVG